jgi:hypothetical protein
MVLEVTSISFARVVAFGYFPAEIAWCMRIMRSSGGRVWSTTTGGFALDFMRRDDFRRPVSASSLELGHA